MRKLMMMLALCLGLACSAAITKVDTLATSLVPGAPMNVTIICPETGTAPYPTAYLLNGYSGNNLDWSTLIRTNLDSIADAYGMVLVMPDGRDSWYWDSPAQPEMKMESFIIDELVPYVDANYPTIPCASKRAITGLSMGGQGAMYLAMRHPDVFGSAGSMSGGVDIRPFAERWNMKHWLGPMSENPQIWDEHSIVAMAQNLQPGTINIIFDCGTDDFFAAVNEDLHHALLERGIAHDYTSRPGAHTRQYWRNSILYHLLFFSEAFSK